ncbi:Hydantoinase B/oxoprolinase domain-containing protein [Bordetella sputigena]|uniref:hydantoinase B/oxoprolinase family protein n=1 Tax=Bordetella sputigena TaxID=1416810 RepID=UPI0039EE8C87
MSQESATIDRDIFQHQLVGIAEEMSRALRRSAYSSIIWDMYDYATAMFTPEGEMLAQSETVTAQLGTMATALSHLRQAIPLETWKPGDVLICNDPYKGCTHTPDITLFSPVFNDGELIAVASTIAHHIDIGGRFPGTTVVDNVEVFAEGLIFPQVRFIEEGRQNPIVTAFIESNVRYPKACFGDLRAQVAGCRTAERRLAELAQQHGNAGFRRLAAATLDYGERYTRAVIAELPDGRYEAETRVENNISSDELIRVRAGITIQGDTISVDFAGSSDQVGCALNVPWSSTVSLTTYALKCLLTPDIPQNGGCNRPVSISAPEGCILNPRRAAAVGSRHYIAQAVADAVLKALAPVVPAHSAAGAHISFPIFRAGGMDDRPQLTTPKPFAILDIIGGGMGGSRVADGLNAVDTHGGNCSILSAEVMETFSPVRVLKSALIPGSGGDGMRRGGLGIERVYEILCTSAVGSAKLQQSSVETAPWGAEGGAPGAAGEIVYNPGKADEQMTTAARSKPQIYKRGDVIVIRSAGGGGYGDPARRGEDDRARDAEQGYI